MLSVAHLVTSDVHPSWSKRAEGRPTIATPHSRSPSAQPIANKPLSGGARCRLELNQADYTSQGGFSGALERMATSCSGIIPEPVHRGEVLYVDSVGARGGRLFVVVRTVSAHQQERGIGAFAHESYGQGEAWLQIKAASEEDSLAVLENWLKPFDNEAEAAQFGNTASGVYVKQVKAGMSFAQVEAALGPPSTRVDLGEKVLYKYKDMTVEFHDGNVTDVR